MGIFVDLNVKFYVNSGRFQIILQYDKNAVPIPKSVRNREILTVIYILFKQNLFFTAS